MGHVVRRDAKTGPERERARWQAAYRGPDGREHTATYRRKADAEHWLAEHATEVARGSWVDPKAGKQDLGTYARAWLAGRQGLPSTHPDALAERTHELYGHLLERHILPKLGNLPLAALMPSIVRAWHTGLATEHPPPAAKAYRLLRQILSAAVADKIIRENPCQVKGAAREKAPERPVASVAEVAALTEANASTPPHRRATGRLVPATPR